MTESYGALVLDEFDGFQVAEVTEPTTKEGALSAAVSYVEQCIRAEVGPTTVERSFVGPDVLLKSPAQRYGYRVRLVRFCGNG